MKLKRVRAESIQDERVCKMAMGAGRSRAPVSKSKGVGIIPPTIDVDAVL